MSNVKILFVDDDQALLSALRAVFRRDRDRWDLSFALGGAAALDLLEAERYDVVVTDMRMPHIDGAALLQRVRELSADTIRIMLSGSTDTEDLARATVYLDELLTKPCENRLLRATIERLLAARGL